jgi:hypothetical protein
MYSEKKSLRSLLIPLLRRKHQPNDSYTFILLCSVLINERTCFRSRVFNRKFILLDLNNVLFFLFLVLVFFPCVVSETDSPVFK